MKTSASTPWFFLAPNMIVILLFTFVPIAINIHYSFTGGVNLYPTQRPGVGVDNFSTLLECASYFDPSSCRKDVFWRSVWNTMKYAPLDREEYIEQTYFFRVYRERLEQNVATQDILLGVHEEILSTTRLPMAIDFLRGRDFFPGTAH